MPRPSQKLIAQKLGISTATVSLALRNKGTVSKKLADRVKAVAEEIGYKPNPILASLASQHFKSSESSLGIPIALIDFLDTPYNKASYFNPIQERAHELGYSITHITPKELKSYHSPDKTLYNRGVQGIILLGPVSDRTFRDDFDWSLFSVLLCGRFLAPLPFDTVRPNIFQSVNLAYQQVRAHGYKRIGLAIGRHEPMMEDDASRYSAALGIQRIEEPDAELIPPYFGPLEDDQKLVSWVREHDPDCVIGFHVGQCSTMRDEGINIPEDLAYASLHIAESQIIGGEKPLCVAGNEQNKREIAIQCMNLMDQKVKYHERGIPEFPKHILINSTWLDGESLPDKTKG
ncbi:LacI family DNA-binding transcriptional regulator [Pelagicoccus mobilis]|uniref:LacI family DNA-binding transcriptional regulator n=1 Tax=Pelagicoccus mobilis TaxID=415221 RepID=A0A934VT61_9BACT|nr:LacI family DNA-binding transcriptional regulator [Pelagicoccus mobilis]MBK1879740.1 LacI family DNA-binding transcriptional regulator [Pelagicoccus mobilis]